MLDMRAHWAYNRIGRWYMPEEMARECCLPAACLKGPTERALSPALPSFVKRKKAGATRPCRGGWMECEM